LNRDAAESLDLSIDLRAFPPITTCEAVEIAGPDLLATNTAERTDAVEPSRHEEFSIKSDRLTAKLGPLSWNTLSLSYAPKKT
jgi:alpha-L-arabinofuranosidase